MFTNNFSFPPQRIVLSTDPQVVKRVPSKLCQSRAAFRNMCGNGNGVHKCRRCRDSGEIYSSRSGHLIHLLLTVPFYFADIRNVDRLSHPHSRHRHRRPPFRNRSTLHICQEVRGSRQIQRDLPHGVVARPFGDTVRSGAVLSPLTAAAHKSRFSPFAPYSYATKPVEMVAESGANAMLIKTLNENPMVGNVAALSKPTSNVGPASVVVTVDANKGYTHLSAIGMLAPTPDWVTFFNNVNVCYRGWWLPYLSGRLYGWDAGTEKTMGVDQQPRQNIYRLQAPRYPRYGKYPVGYFTIRKI